MADIQDRGKKFSHLLASELKGAISAYGFTAKAVASSIGIDYSTLSRYFNGSRALPATVLNDACEVIGASPDALVDRAYQRLIRELGPYGTEPLHAVNRREDVSVRPAIFDPEEHDLAAHKDTRDEDTDF